MMDRGEKQSFDQMEVSPSVEEYVLSASDHHNLKIWSRKRPVFDRDDKLDMNTKMAALKASSFIVSLVSFSGEEMVSQSCGTILEAEGNNHTVITSLNLIRKPTKANFVENTLADNLKIIVRLSHKSSYLGEIYVYDFHYNLLVLKFKSKTPLAPAKVVMIDDDFGRDMSFQLRPHASKVKPGDAVVAVGRYFYNFFNFMAAPGSFSFSMDHRHDAEYDCRELLSNSCDITRCGDGAPVINLSGEVIGIVFYEITNTSPFLPINIISKWWDHYKTYKELRHPSYGFEARNLYLSSLSILERVTTRVRDISNGILVEKVQVGSFAESAGLRKYDVITKCDGKSVKGFLKLWELMWDKVGDVVVLEVARFESGTTLSITMMVGEATPNELNKWPRYDYC